MCTKMINNDKHVHNWIKFNEIGSAGVKYFSTETVSTAKYKTLWYSIYRFGLLQWKKKPHGNHEIMWTFCTIMTYVIPYPVSFKILYWKANIVSCHVLCVKNNGHVLFAMKRVNNQIYKCNDTYYTFTIYIARIQIVILQKKKSQLFFFFQKLEHTCH